MSTLWDTFAPKTEEVVPSTHGWLFNPTWLLTGFAPLGVSWHMACFLCLTVACYLTVFRLVRWNRSTRHRLEDNLDRLVTMKQFSELTDQHQRVRTQMNHQVHMYGLLDEEVDRLRDDAKTMLKTVASAERALLPERLRLRDLQEQQQREQQQQQRRHKLPAGPQQRRRRPAAVQRLRQRPHATSSAPTSLPASAHAHCEPAPAPAAASTTAAVSPGPGAAAGATDAVSAGATEPVSAGASGGNGCQPPPPPPPAEE